MVALTRQEAEGTPEAALWDTPDDWPKNVRIIPLDRFDALGEDPKTGQLYWEGRPLMLKRRFETFERVLAVVGLIIAGLGSAAAIVQAVVALMAYEAGPAAIATPAPRPTATITQAAP